MGVDKEIKRKSDQFKNIQVSGFKYPEQNSRPKKLEK